MGRELNIKGRKGVRKGEEKGKKGGRKGEENGKKVRDREGILKG